MPLLRADKLQRAAGSTTKVDVRWSMLLAALALFLLLVTIGAAAIIAPLPDARAGFWEATTSHNGLETHFRLALQTLWQMQPNGVRTGAIHGHLYALDPGGGSCPFETHENPVGQHLRLECLFYSDHKYVASGEWLDIVFNLDGKAATLVWHKKSRPVTLHFTRFPQDTGVSPMVGNWIAAGPGMSCVLHVYVRDHRTQVEELLAPQHLAVSLDMISTGSGDSGRDLGGIDYDSQNGDSVQFSIEAADAALFIGHLDKAQGKLTGNFERHSDCNIFSRLPSSPDKATR